LGVEEAIDWAFGPCGAIIANDLLLAWVFVPVNRRLCVTDEVPEVVTVIRKVRKRITVENIGFTRRLSDQSWVSIAILVGGIFASDVATRCLGVHSISIVAVRMFGSEIKRGLGVYSPGPIGVIASRLVKYCLHVMPGC
jgi:hypothetical protein